MTGVRSGRIETDLRELAAFSAPGPGVTRLSYTDEHRAARDYIVTEMREAGLSVREDALGNITGRREGSEPSLPAIAVGSHFDSVRNGGMFDGTAGVVCALELARAFASADYRNRHPFEFIAILEEEGTRFGSGMLGGRAIAGLVRDVDLDTLRDDEGVSVREAATAFGLAPEALDKAARSRDELRVFIEPHIEQGPVLEQEGLEIGVVTAIVGIRVVRVSVTGRSDHAGTTPMHLRQDALVPAATMVTEVNRLVRALADGTVGTVGRLSVAPGGVNQVPGQVDFTIDLRSPNKQSLDGLVEEIDEMVWLTASRSGVTAETKAVFSLDPVELAPNVVAAVRQASAESGFSHRDMVSGAGHDSMFIAQVTDVGMLFVPSLAGRSHVPEEWTGFDALRKGAEVVMSVMTRLDESG